MSKKNTFKIDTAHSNIGFKIRHMMFAKVNGRFEEYSASIEMPEDNFEKAVLAFEAKTKSINTNNEERDEHLRSSDFFNAVTYPKIFYYSKSIQKIADNKYEVEGFLSMNGIKNYIKLEAQYNGIVKDPEGVERIPLTLAGSLDRYVWNMKWNKPLQSGGILVSKEVNLIIECEFIR